MRDIAVIGSGYWGKNLVRNFFRLGRLNTICDLDRGREAEYKGVYGDVGFVAESKEVFNNPKIKGVVIATPAETHFKLTKEALMHGKDVFVEKPLALKVSEARKLSKLADMNKCILMIDHLLHYHPALIKLKKMISKGILGDIQYIYSNRLSIGKFRKEENILWSFAPHDISVILSLAKQMPISVTAFGDAYLQKNIYDTTVTTLRFKSRLKAHVFVNWLHPFKEQKLVVIGTKNMAVFNDRIEDKLVLYPHKVKWIDGMPVAAKASHTNVPVSSQEPLERACRHFIECMKKRTRPLTDANEALNVLKVLNSAQRSLEKN